MVIDGVAAVLAYTALILAILCSIAEKWNYFSSLLNGEPKKHKTKYKNKKKKKCHIKNNDNSDFISNDEFYHNMGLI